MRRASGRIALVVAGLLIAWVSLTPRSAAAQTWEDFYRLGTDAYNDKKFSEAISNYAKAIQAAPASAKRAYLNMARAYYQMKQYPEAHRYYAWYLEMEPGDRRARGELKGARRKTRLDEPPSITTDAQSAALQQLQKAIEEGVFVAPDGGGAMAFYDVLLRTRYAAPNLAAIQQTLASGLLREALQVATPPPGRPVPELDRAGWDAIKARVARATSFSDAQVDAQLATALVELANGWQAYLKADYQEALTRFDAAIASQEALLAAHWGRALAVMFTDGTLDQKKTLDALDAAAAAFESVQRSPAPFVPLMRAKALQAAGKADEAAEIVDDL